MNTLGLLPNLFNGDGLIIFLILLLLFGSRRRPDLVRGLSRGLGFEVPDKQIHQWVIALLFLFLLLLLFVSLRQGSP